MSSDAYSAQYFGAPTLAPFDPSAQAHRAAAAALHDRLVEVGFGSDAAALFSLAEIADVRAGRAAYYDECVLPASPGGEAARFFVLHRAQPASALRAWLGDEHLDFLREIAAVVERDGTYRSVISATWFDGRLIFTDARVYDLVWPDAEPFADLVMPPGGDSIGLVRVAPRAHRRKTLDLCCGAGAQTLAAAAYSVRVVGVDINPRAVRFARFNAAVNRIETARFEQGDLYAPLGDERFDAIVANPPFVPWPPDGTALLFRGGGPRGEDAIERIFAGAVAHLEPDGSLAMVADFVDADALPQRIQAWQQTAWQTLLLLQHRYELIGYAERHAAHLPTGPERQAEAVRLMRHFAAVGIQTLDVGYVVQVARPGTTHVTRTDAALSGSIAEVVTRWFAL